MDLSHQSITGHNFELNRRGYDPDLVDAHLASIAAAVADRNARLTELESTVETLQAKVQDAKESEEAFRLTLKAAAHAKEELLANARDEAKRMEDEAAGKAASIVADAEGRANELATSAEARARAMEEGARERAVEVAKAAVVESEALVARIEDLRGKLAAAEAALMELRTDTDPKVDAAREALDEALTQARETAENPELLAASAAVAAAPVAFPEQSEQQSSEEQPPGHAEEQPLGHADSMEAMPEQQTGSAESAPAGEHDTAEEEPPVFQAQQPAEAPASQAPQATEEVGQQPEHHQPDQEAVPSQEMQPATNGEVPEGGSAEAGDTGPHLEVVEEPLTEDGESAADISDKVDRLLEELREVT